MKEFWALAARHWPLSMARRRLDSAISKQGVEVLLAAGLLARGALLAYQPVTCLECHGTARLVPEPEGLVAVCTGDMECPAEEFGPAPERVFIEPGTFARGVARTLGLEGAPAAEGVVCPLGRRMLGDVPVAFDLVPRPHRAGVQDALHRLVRGGPRVRVVLVPDSRRLPADAPAEVAGVELVWVGLDELLVVGASLRADLRPVLLRRHFGGLAIELTFDGLVLNERGATWRGCALPIEEAPLQLHLLRLLAASPGALVTKAALWRELYPDDVTAQGKPVRGMNPDDLDDKLRSVVLLLRAAFRAVDPEAAGLVENRRGKGYLLALPDERVRSSYAPSA